MCQYFQFFSPQFFLFFSTQTRVIPVLVFSMALVHNPSTHDTSRLALRFQQYPTTLKFPGFSKQAHTIRVPISEGYFSC